MSGPSSAPLSFAGGADDSAVPAGPPVDPYGGWNDSAVAAGPAPDPYGGWDDSAVGAGRSGPGTRNITVKSGQTLERLAGTSDPKTLDRIAEYNGLRSRHEIRAGQSLVIPDADTLAGVDVSSAVAKRGAAGAAYYAERQAQQAAAAAQSATNASSGVLGGGQCTIANPYGLNAQEQATVNYAIRNPGTSGIKASDLSYGQQMAINDYWDGEIKASQGPQVKAFDAAAARARTESNRQFLRFMGAQGEQAMGGLLSNATYQATGSMRSATMIADLAEPIDAMILPRGPSTRGLAARSRVESGGLSEVGIASGRSWKVAGDNTYFKSSVTFDTSGYEGSTGISYKVFQRADIDWQMVREGGAKQARNLTNAEAAARYGIAPILPDGSVATLHHSQQNAMGPLFEASTRYHEIRNAQRAPLHPYGREQHPEFPLGSGPGSVRDAFQRVDSIQYWKSRGSQELGR